MKQIHNKDLLAKVSETPCMGQHRMGIHGSGGVSPGASDSRSLRSIRENVPWAKKSPPGVERAEKIDSISDFVG